MKKYLALVLGMLMVFGFAASAHASGIHAAIPGETRAVVAPAPTDIRLGGEIRIRGFYQDNITNAAGTEKRATGLPYDSGSMAWYDQRVRLFLNVRTAPNVTGRIMLETAGENYTWGATNAIATTGGEVFAGGGVGMNLHEAWLAYTGKGLLGVTSGIRAGRQPLVIGEGTFFDHRRRGSDAILLWVEPAKGTDVHFVTAKLFDGITAAPRNALDNTDDIDLYSLILTHRLDRANTIGVNLSLITSSDVVGSATALGSLGGFYRMPPPAAAANYARAKLDLWNLGLLARGTVSEIGYKATLDFQFGSVDNIIGVGGVPGTPAEVDFEGYGITLGANYRINPVTLRANFVYGSGDGNTDGKNEAFQTFVGNVIDPNLPTVVYGWRVDTAAGAGIRGTGIANTTAFNLGITFSPFKDVTTHVDYYILRASERLAAAGSGLFGSDKEIGSELNLRTTWTIARGLSYHINAGVLFAGDFYKVGTTGPASDPKDAIVFQHGLVFSF